MSVLKRLNTLVRSNLNDLSSRVGQRNVMREVTSSVREAKAQQVEVRALEKRLSREYEALLDEAAQWEQRAEMALRSNNEELARQALGRKQQIDRRAQGIKQSLDEQQSYLLDLESSMHAIEVKFDGMRDHQRAVSGASSSRPVGAKPAARYERTASLEASAELSGFGDPDTFATFDRMSDRIDVAEAQFEAMRELNADLDPAAHDTELEAKFRHLETDKQLDKMKKKSDSMDELRRRLEEE